MEEIKDNKNRKIEIVKGNSKDLDISDVKDNLTFEVHDNNAKKNGNIIIPKEKKEKKSY